VYSLITCFAAFDVLMAMAPKWYSTIYGVNFWGSACVGGFAALALTRGLGWPAWTLLAASAVTVLCALWR